VAAHLEHVILVEGNKLLERNHPIAIGVDAPDHLFALIERDICPASLPALARDVPNLTSGFRL
jgi:hypothetical protein